MSSPHGWPCGQKHLAGLKLFFVLLLAACCLLVPAGGGPAGAEPGDASLEFVPDELLVQLRAGVPDDRAKEIYRGQGAALIDRVPQIRTHVIRVPAPALEKVQTALARRPEFKFVERNRLYPSEFIPDDPYYSNQWHHPSISDPPAWDLSQGDGITIAILDSGVDPAHPDLAAKLVPGYNFWDNNTDTTDVYGHGTKVAGSAAAAGNNALGVAGVAYDAMIMPIRVTGTDGYATTSALAKGVTWAADHGARVMNMSFAGIAGSSTITSAAQYARSKKAVVVASAGNCGCDDPTPENPYIISVAATTSTDALASFSSRGVYVDVAAPGSGIYTTARGGGYSSVSGTSFSSPITAGVVALIMAANSTLDTAAVEQILLSTADDLGAPGRDTSFGQGLVNAWQAVKAAGTAPSPTPDTTPPTAAITAPADGAGVTGTITVGVAASDNVSVGKVELYLNGSLFATDSSAPYTFAWDTAKSGDGTHTLTAKAYDAAGNQATSAPVRVSVSNSSADTTPPAVAITAPAGGSTVTKVTRVTAQASDNGLVSAVDILVDGKVVQTTTANASAVTVTYSWNTRKDGAGPHTLSAVARDAAGNRAVSAPVAVTVK